jgi:NADPH-dependent curcumin reductase CurA
MEEIENSRCVFAKYPEGELDESLFRFEQCPYPEPIGEGQLFLKLSYISIDSHMRVRMSPMNQSFEVFQENQPYEVKIFNREE